MATGRPFLPSSPRPGCPVPKAWAVTQTFSLQRQDISPCPLMNRAEWRALKWLTVTFRCAVMSWKWVTGKREDASGMWWDASRRLALRRRKEVDSLHLVGMLWSLLLELLSERLPFPPEMSKVGGALCTIDGSSTISVVITAVIKVRGSHCTGPPAGGPLPG